MICKLGKLDSLFTDDAMAIRLADIQRRTDVAFDAAWKNVGNMSSGERAQLESPQRIFKRASQSFSRARTRVSRTRTK
jgi:hypothetical protein